MSTEKTTTVAEAVRNLIVCDTQFGWTGETTLKLPELLDLQARGWLIEGDENNEFSLTTEGESVVARALQRADERATPSANWSAEGQPDPHGRRYACERAALALGHLTDDELANAVYLHGNEQPSMADLVAGKALSGIVYLTAAKERIRWLSRALSAATAQQPAELAEQQGQVIVHALADAYAAGAEGLQFGGLARMEALAAALAATGKQQAGEVHPDDAAVDAFADAMKAKMADARAKGRGGWEDPAQCSSEDLSRMLRDHVEKGDPRDVANFCMMLHQRREAIAARKPGVWNSMDSAPKDGTEVLIEVELRAGVRGKCLVGHYMAGGHCIEDHPPIAGGWYFWNGCAFDMAAKPIRWRHIQPAQGIDLGQVHAAVESLLEFADHHESCGDSDSYNNAEFQTCGCGLDSAREQIWDALDGQRDAAPGVGS